MFNLIEAVTTDGLAEPNLQRAVEEHVVELVRPAGRGKREWVYTAEWAVRRHPGKAFTFDQSGTAILSGVDQTWQCGRFETPTLAELRRRCERSTASRNGQVRLWVLDGASPATDIGALQATSGQGTLFQVASQFNCLESPGPYVTNVGDYFSDPTQGPRASISAFPATLLRHYSAPRADGTRFVQVSDGPQVELLAGALSPGSAPNGYFTGMKALGPRAQVDSLEENFEQIRVGIHDEAEVALGYDWDGPVPVGTRPRIAQVFTSTVAGGSYGGEAFFGREFDAACRPLLRAAYLGTLMSAVSLGRSRVVLCLIGGGVFRNRPRTILEAIGWAIEQAEPLVSGTMDVVVNGWNVGRLVDLNHEVLPMVRTRGGALLQFDSSGLIAVRR